ncbi:MAG: hypothetical protein CVT74_15585 [Alphaproteobacteria bacterium HGW-Alphaproteobacteria-13]|jgi:Ni/Co efflux regulator RcnB|nr:MAG: hypothetical protein CVT74_15585 [Alphaproteobacteria bacterium HGW-Alphaproteobacteria-13]
MKSKFLTIGVIAAMMIPAAAQAAPQTRHAAYDRPAIGKTQPQARDMRHDSRSNPNDWRRDTRYQSFRAPFAYQSFRAGSSIRSNYYAPAYRLNYDNRWSVPRAGKNMTYVRHYNDLLLVNVRTGKVVKVYRNQFRWR